MSKRGREVMDAGADVVAIDESAGVADGKVLTGAATSGVRYVKASAVRVSDYIMIGDRACKVVTLAVSKTGKHGHGKVRFSFSDGDDCAVYRQTEEVLVRSA
jgi:hypothetical protein